MAIYAALHGQPREKWVTGDPSMVNSSPGQRTSPVLSCVAKVLRPCHEARSDRDLTGGDRLVRGLRSSPPHCSVCNLGCETFWAGGLPCCLLRVDDAARSRS